MRLKAGLSEARRAEAIGLVRAAVAMAQFKPRNGATYTVTGAPVVVADLSASIGGSLRTLLVVALLVMAATLALVFRVRPRLLPLAIALVAVALTFGALSLAGASLTIASIAVLPVLIGLAVDYAIQLQSRIAEERGSASGGARGAPLGVAAAARRAALLGAPAIATAAAATAAGFAVLALSPVPMVRGFGLLLVAGIAIAFAVALLAGTAALVLADRARRCARRRAGRAGRRVPAGRRGRRRRGGRPARDAASRAPRRQAWAARRRAALAGDARAACAGRRALAFAIARPARVLAIGLAVAAAGWALDTQTRVESDIQRLVPQDMPALRDLDALQRSTGVGGELDVVVEGADLTSPHVIAWMTAFQTAVLEEHGFSARARLRPGRAVPRVLAARPLHDARLAHATPPRSTTLLDAVPPYFSRSVITADRRTATLAFGIRLMALDEQKRVDRRDARAPGRRPPAGRAAPRSPACRSSPPTPTPPSPRACAALLTLLAGLLAVALVLLVAFRDLERALVPLVPIALATGWSALVLFCLRIPLNPMSVTLGALVIAISTEFSVLLSERYREERAARARARARRCERTYRSTGAAVLASGTTAIAGFAVLVASDIRMLRDFGFVTVVDLTVSLLGVLVVLPAVLLLAERRRAASPESALRRGGPAERRSDDRGQRAALAIGHRADGLRLRHADVREELAAARRPPTTLAEQQLGDRHARRLPRAREDDRADGRPPLGDAALELGAREPDLVRALKCLHMLRRRGDRRCCVVHVSSLAAPSVERQRVMIC